MGRPSSIKVGNIYTNNQGAEFTVTAKSSLVGFWKIRFNDSGEFKDDVSGTNIMKGQVSNRFKPTSYGVGFLGDGPFTSSRIVNGVQNRTQEYEVWHGMLKRCYCAKTQSRQPAYSGCSVSPEWFNFQTFAAWYIVQPGYVEGWDIDKDLLIKGNKVYSKETCVLLPRELNSLLALVNFVGDRFLPRGIHMRTCGTYRVELGGMGEPRHTKTFKTLIEAVENRNLNTDARVAKIATAYNGVLTKEVIELLTKRLYSILYIPTDPVEE